VHAIAIGGIAAVRAGSSPSPAGWRCPGIGPFTATVANVVPAQQGLDVTLTVRNTGSSSGQTTCHISDPADRTSNQGAYVLSPSVAAGQTVTFTKHVTELGTTTKPLEVECPTP
jgi:hypothetical protein